MTEAKRPIPETPELDRRSAIMESRRPPHEVLTEFYDWLGEQGYFLAKYEDVGYRDKMLVPSSPGPEQLFADFFGIDLDKIDLERRGLLEHLRESAVAER